MECIRRNEEYWNDYKEWQAVPQDEPFEREEKEAAIADKWVIRTVEPLPNPFKHPPLENVLKAVPMGEVRLPQHERVDPLTWAGLNVISAVFSESGMSDPMLRGLMIIGYTPEESPGTHHRIVLNMRWSKKTIMNALDEFVTKQLTMRRKAKLKQVERGFKTRLKEWVKFLKVYDEKNAGKSFSR